MAQIDARLSTGMAGLDSVFRGLIPGDNIVWQVDAVEDYRAFLEPYGRSAARIGQPLVYFRFARHEPLLGPDSGAAIHQLDPAEGFEAFLTEIHRVIEEVGHGGFYVFDCLTDLAVDWHSDQMLGNFFMLTCPYLFDVEAVAYFALLRHHHAPVATQAITETAQVVVDVFRKDGQLYIHPQKVQQRYSPTMYMLHAWRGESFVPVVQSPLISEILMAAHRRAAGGGMRSLGHWERTFLDADELLAHGDAAVDQTPEYAELFGRLLRMIISRDERVLALAQRYLTLSDVVAIGKRMLGTGLIGGKAVGMLLARAIIARSDAELGRRLEPHDSFYIGSDVFYTFLVRNGIWWVRQRQKDAQSFLEGSERARQGVIRGSFPDTIRDQFSEMLDYFGQSPIIVRSSSLLEDNFGNAFAGKYESVFCVNQGSREKRLEDFTSAVRTIYASAMSEKALSYRARRGLLDRDEQMALLVQRVSGAMYGRLYYPQVAGVGFSVNPYVWNESIDPAAGMIRLVFGLGTRAVDRADDDYTRVVALNAPQLRPESHFDKARQYAQRKVDVLDLEANQLVSGRFEDVARTSPELPLDLLASRDTELEQRAAGAGREGVFSWWLTFDRLLTATGFAADVRRMLRLLHEAYDYPVDVEFTANFFEGDQPRVNLLQCRPLQVKGGGSIVDPPADIPETGRVLEAHGAVIGQSRRAIVDRLIYVSPRAYGQLPVADRYSIARLIGRLAHLPEQRPPENILLVGPGRWGTTTPSLGVPVSFGEINTVSALCEVVAMRDGLVPDVSLGTHFFSDLVETDILYLALFPAREGNRLNAELIESWPSRLTDLLPGAAQWADVVRVIDAPDLAGQPLILHANSLSQRVLCYLGPAAPAPQAPAASQRRPGRA